MRVSVPVRPELCLSDRQRREREDKREEKKSFSQNKKREVYLSQTRTRQKSRGWWGVGGCIVKSSQHAGGLCLQVKPQEREREKTEGKNRRRRRKQNPKILQANRPSREEPLIRDIQKHEADRYKGSQFKDDQAKQQILFEHPIQEGPETSRSRRKTGSIQIRSTNP